jgi:DNA modification methylase
MNKIICGDSLEILKTLESESVNCVITSPPYWALRDYGVEGQLGLEPTFQEYITKLCDIFDEVKRVLKKEGTFWLNLGDSYSNSGKGGDSESMYAKRHTEFGKISDIRRHGKPTRVKDLPPKSLCNIPSRVSIELQNRGWILRNEIIWHKPNCMPSSVKDRFTVDFEKVFFFVKSKKYWFDKQYEPRITQPIKDLERIRNQQKGNNKNNQGGVSTFKNTLTDEQILEQANKGRTKRCVWTITTKPFKEAHFATYPEQLIEPMIKAGCPVGGIVLDPFFGAGTTGLVAKKLERNYLGIELNPEYIDIATRRINGLPQKLFNGLKQDNTGNPTYKGFNKRYKESLN